MTLEQIAADAITERDRLRSLNAELLAALKQAENWLIGGVEREQWNDALQSLRAAIAKAEATK